MNGSEAVTRGIRVTVESQFVPERSAPDQNQWFFSYSIRIQNEGEQPVQLMTRHWIITDSSGETQEVRGDGVVGEQPRLEPGTFFDYTSACPLHTSFGTMHGSYGVVTDSGERFDVTIAPFALSEPYAIH